MFIEVSYSLDPDEIVMPGKIDKPKVIKRSRMIDQPAGDEGSMVRWGSYNNTSVIEYFAHTGTHIDVPFHADPEGTRLHEFGLNDFIFDNTLLLEIPKKDKEKITVEELTPHKDRLSKCDILLIYTGFSRIRKMEPERYVSQQPSFTIDAANYLVDNFDIRCYGVDLIGIENIPDGKVSTPTPFPIHKTFLLKKQQKSFVLEDLNLMPLLGKTVSRFFVIPLRIYGAEAMPVTVFAEVED
ncbi:Kynurenine formamidase [subsurface metagenome]